jgi:succinate dehydrogenase / fumarate reductase cytochrome b subunit
MAKLTAVTAVAKKVAMAVTGLALCGFLVAHLAGNLQLLWNTSQFNAYAHFLTVSMGPLTLLFEAGLLAIFALHIIDAIVLLKGNYDARPVGYYKKGWGRSKSKRSRKSWSSTLMMWSGVVILLFVVFHVWHFKYHHPVASPPIVEPGTAAPAVGLPNDAPGAGVPSMQEYDLAQLVFNEFHSPIVVGIYLFCLFVLAAHLYHAVSSALTTVGANTPRFQKPILWIGKAFAIVIPGAFMLFPILILTGILHNPKPPVNAEANAALTEPAP